MDSLGIKPSHVENLIALKFDKPKARRLKAQGYGLIWTIYYDTFYEAEARRAKAMLEAQGLTILQAEDKAYYKLNHNADLTIDMVHRISRDMADRNVEVLSKIAIKRDFIQHLNTLVTNFTGNEATLNYVEFVVGFKIKDKEQCDALRQFYVSLTPTYNATVGF